MDIQPSLWQCLVVVRRDRVEDIVSRLDDEAESIAAFEVDAGRWQVELLFRKRPETAAITSALNGTDFESLAIAELDDRDWVAINQAAFPPQQLGPFWVHGSHVSDDTPPGAIPILVDAGAAFGSGEHGTTQGCLEALADLRRTFHPKRILDMGCGSAILAIAAAKLWTCRGVAADNDPFAIATGRNNVRANGVHHRVRVIRSDGYNRTELRRAGRFDLIIANILAKPLCSMAGGLAHALAPGGYAILSGLLHNQAFAVRQAHRRAGLRPKRQLQMGPWTTLVMRKPI
ncbi:MAG: 50S ribosomal protein L11 methyltransferase [Geminicoccaceae bacterium]